MSTMTTNSPIAKNDIAPNRTTEDSQVGNTDTHETSCWFILYAVPLSLHTQPIRLDRSITAKERLKYFTAIDEHKSDEYSKLE